MCICLRRKNIEGGGDNRLRVELRLYINTRLDLPFDLLVLLVIYDTNLYESDFFSYFCKPPQQCFALNHYQIGTYLPR